MSETSRQTLRERLQAEAAADAEPAMTPDVGIVMGSSSDLPVMRDAHRALEEVGFFELSTTEEPPADDRHTYETFIISAHRTPELMMAYGQTAAQRGLSLIIAGAGGKSADLPTMLASVAFPLPVIGVPIDDAALGSVIGNPTGAPILAVDAGKAYNAGLAAAQILGADDPELHQRLIEFHAAQAATVAAESLQLHDEGVDLSQP
jgi:Phosphoribosylcarboxyaminoimidazole (NCAIR) mutase